MPRILTNLTASPSKMVRHWTDKQLAEELKKLTIICDSREQVNAHVTKYFDAHHIPHIERKLDTGDYSAQLGEMSLERDICVERKHNLDEICGNFTAERERFEREFMRAKAYGTKVVLIGLQSSRLRAQFACRVTG